MFGTPIASRSSKVHGFPTTLLFHTAPQVLILTGLTAPSAYSTNATTAEPCVANFSTFQQQPKYPLLDQIKCISNALFRIDGKDSVLVWGLLLMSAPNQPSSPLALL